MWIKRPLRQRSVRVHTKLEDYPAFHIVNGLTFEETRHGWVESLPIGIRWKQLHKEARQKALARLKAKATKGIDKHQSRFAWNRGCHPDIYRFPKPLKKKTKYNFPLPGPEQIAAIMRRKKEEEEMRTRKEVNSINESAQVSLGQSSYVYPDLGRSPNPRRISEDRLEIGETKWKRKHRFSNGKRKRKEDRPEIDETNLKRKYRRRCSSGKGKRRWAPQ